MQLFKEKGVVNVFYEEDEMLQIHEWLNYSPDGDERIMFKALDRIYQLLIEYPVTKVLVIADQAKGAFSPNLQAFIRETQFPRLISDTQIRFVATVKPADLLAQVYTDVWKEQLKQNSTLIMHDVADEASGRRWLREAEALANS
ncbi:hypothetical protein [Aliikangiella sp. G2MR2-5]|uniref:hypothetical protein n=1 Tax=Aliikangiella sp. G2MR2-5 TaxID=2788943 RepID=UPI0018A8E1E1|nr:hypothetical protein [Aliikangiella sp. G2MR2-5]